MKVIWKAACAAVLLAICVIEIGCGETYRPIATPSPVTTGNPSGAETEVVLNQAPNVNSVLTNINVSGDTNSGNKAMGNVASSIAFDANRTTVYSANTATDSVTQVLLNSSTAGFSANTTTIALEPGSAPIGMTFQYFGTTYTQDYVVNSGTSTAICPGTGSLSAITQSTNLVKATICVGSSTAPANPVYAWIYMDQSKVFVLDNSSSSGNVYVVSTSKYKVTNKISVEAAPIKAAQSADGTYVYVLNSAGGNGNGSISVIDGQAESVNQTVSTNACGTLCESAPIDIAQDAQYNDTTKNLQYNHIWILHANGMVSVFDATTPGQLKWISSLATGANPTNLALMRDGTQAYVGLSGTDKIVAIDASRLVSGDITQNATTTITVGVHRTITQSINDTKGVAHTVLAETTTPTVNHVAVSRQGDSAYLSKAYATTTTKTIYNCYDENVNPTDCTPSLPSAPPTPSSPATCQNIAGQNQMSCDNLYNGTAVVTAAANGSTPINTYVTTVPAPSVVTYCDPVDPDTGIHNGQKNCPAMAPVLVLGRS